MCSGVVKRRVCEKPGIHGQSDGIGGAPHHPVTEMAEKVGGRTTKIVPFGKVKKTG
jgi:hypothetical protein